MRFTPLRIALIGIVLVVAFQWFVVQGYGGNWTMLFYAGEKNPPPPALAGAMYLYPNSFGFDGQFYLYIAHDFFDVHETYQYIDNSPMRRRRALVPALAAAISLGDSQRVAASYIAVIWGFCLAGLWISAALAERWGYPAAAGLGFLAIPAVLVSLERMMVDIALVVLLLALVLAMDSRRTAWVYVILALAPLARETGIALIGGWVVFQLWKRFWKPAVYGALTAIPSLAWFWWVHLRFGADGTPWIGPPFAGIAQRLFSYEVFPAPTLGLKLALATEYVGAVGVAASFAIAILLLVRGERSYLVFTAVLYTLGIALFAKGDMWSEAYSYTRTGGPVALLLAVIGLEQRRWWLVAPMLLALPRIVLQYVAVTATATKGWLH